MKTVLDAQTLNELIVMTDKVAKELEKGVNEDIGGFEKYLQQYQGLLKMQMDNDYLDNLFKNMRLNLWKALNNHFINLSLEIH